MRKLDNASEAQPIAKVSRRVGQQIQKARLAKRMTQKELARKLNIAPSAINDYEASRTQLNNQMKMRIERILGVKINR